MNLGIYFSPVNTDVYQDITSTNSFFKSIQIYADHLPDYEEADIALIGLTENRGASEQNHGVAQAADAVRKALYNLKRGHGAYQIIDLGNLRNGPTLEETYLRIKAVCEGLMACNTLPLLIGGSHDLDYGQYQSYESMEKLINMVGVDAMIDIETPQQTGAPVTDNQRHLHKILIHEPNYLLNYSHIAYQSFLVDKSAPTVLEKFYFDTHRLGLVTQDIKLMEPILRNADLISFDMTAVKSEDAPGNMQAQPFGLTGQEACQICWYAGLSERLSSIGFYEYNPKADNDRFKTASVMATMIWYVIEGFYNRKYEEDFTSNDFIKYIVPLEDIPSEINFYKSKLSDKWWMEVPHPETGNIKGRKSIVPCDPIDYKMALKGEIPDRWIQTYAKFS